MVKNGKSKLTLANQGFDQPWKMRLGNRSHSYITDWEGLMVEGWHTSH